VRVPVGRGTVESLLGAIIEAAQYRVVVDVKALVCVDRVDRQRCEEQVDVDTLEVEGDEGHLSALDCGEVFDRVVVLEDHLQRVEKVLAAHVPRRDADGVDVHAPLKDPEPVRARGEDLPASGIGDLLGQTFRKADGAHPLPEDGSYGAADRHPLLHLLRRQGW
jgi:hypothetical protein